MEREGKWIEIEGESMCCYSVFCCLHDTIFYPYYVWYKRGKRLFYLFSLCNKTLKSKESRARRITHALFSIYFAVLYSKSTYDGCREKEMPHVWYSSTLKMRKRNGYLKFVFNNRDCCNIVK
jgi:hypothetical protein